MLMLASNAEVPSCAGQVNKGRQMRALTWGSRLGGTEQLQVSRL